MKRLCFPLPTTWPWAHSLECASSGTSIYPFCLVLMLACLLAGCKKPDPNSVSAPQVSEVVLAEQNPHALALISGCANASRQVDSITSGEEGRVTMRMSIMDCEKYLSEYPKGIDAERVRTLLSQVKALEDRYVLVALIERRLQAGDFEEAREQIDRVAAGLPAADVTRLNTLLVERELAHDAEWLPWTLDVQGYSRGQCTRSELVRRLGDARAWALQDGAIKVQAIQEEATKVAIYHYDGLLRAYGTRTFYQDMATCRAERGQ